ncbi:MAG: hypothetical protein HC898_00335 [Phycisphaerales bacterium]|nr:hypothetical protein [Phycisphaerales bacterium]
MTLDGSSASPIFDRSGLRSNLRNSLVGDPTGTILDGNADGIEGGNYTFTAFAGDAEDDFLPALSNPVTIALDGGLVLLGNTISDPADIDIFNFNAAAGEFLGINLTSDAPLSMAVFYRDHQGTADPADDSFEVLARYEYQFNSDASNLAQFLELPENGDYFIVVRGTQGIFTSQFSGTGYDLSIALTSTDNCHWPPPSGAPSTSMAP